MSAHDPPRLSATLPAEDRLLVGIEALRADNPSNTELFRVEKRLEGALGFHSTSSARRGSDPLRALRAYFRPLLIGAVAGTAVAAVPTVKRWVDDPRPAADPPAARAPSAALRRGVAPEPLRVSPPEVIDAAPTQTPPSSEPAPNAAEPDEASELSLLTRAQSVMASDPRFALELAAEHERRFGQTAAFAAEREVLAIEALLRLGGRLQAHERVRRFRERFPGSAYERRIEMLLENGP